MTFTAEQLAKEFRVSTNTMGRALASAGYKTGKGRKFTVHQGHTALTKKGDSKGSIQDERLRKIRLENELLEQERDRNAKVLVPIEQVQELVGRYTGPIRNAWLAMPTAMAARCNPTDPDVAKKALSEWRDNSLRLTQQDFRSMISEIEKGDS